MDEVEVAGLRVAYERAGVGPALVLLNGYVGDGPATWRRQIDDLSDELTVVAWDAPGSGRSSDPPESWRLADYADCLAGFVRALGLGRPHVAGLSLGGGLALELYRRHPTSPASLVLVGAYAGWAGSLPPEVVDQRLRQALRLAGRPPDELLFGQLICGHIGRGVDLQRNVATHAVRNGYRGVRRRVGLTHGRGPPRSDEGSLRLFGKN